MRSLVLVAALLPIPALAAPIVSGPAVPTSEDPGAGVRDPGPEGPDFADLTDPWRLRAPVRVEQPATPGSAYIVNGQEAEEGEYPEVVYLEIGGLTGGESSCTGSLIDPEWILTAAHCVDALTVDEDGDLIHEELVPTTRITARWVNRVGEAGDSAVSSGTLIHEKWKSNDGGQYEGDIALIKLQTAQVDKPLMALNAKTLSSANIGDQIRFIGFGKTEWQGGGGGVKRYNLEKVVAVPETVPYLLNSFDIDGRQPTNGGQSTCQGDSGGPGVFLQGLAYIQATITSHGPECGKGPSGHMRVDTYLDWIRGYVPNIVTKAASTPTFECSHLLDPENPETIAFGVVPFSLNCSVGYQVPEGEELKQVVWDWGDGTDRVTVDSGDKFKANHVYQRNGRFSVTMEATYTQGGAERTKKLTRFGYVRACGEPNVRFSVAKDDGLTYQFINETNISEAYGCVTGTQWDIFEGDSASGSPMTSLKTWEPAYTFETPGTYTAVLNVGGVSGTVAARATFDVTTARRSEGSGCNQSGAPAGFGVLALGLVGLLARRRDRV